MLQATSFYYIIYSLYSKQPVQIQSDFGLISRQPVHAAGLQHREGFLQEVLQQGRGLQPRALSGAPPIPPKTAEMNINYLLNNKRLVLLVFCSLAH